MDKLQEIRESTNKEHYKLGMRCCVKCELIKPLTSYYADKFQSTGYQYTCKECVCQIQKEKRKIDPNRTREIVRRSYAREDVKRRAHERFKRYRESNYVKMREREKKQSQTEHSKVRQIFRNALTAGKIIRPDTCEECGAKTFVEGHHFDYSKPLEVKWLCRTCHGEAHQIS